jgi:uncharacterized phage infection (PIP) family protein YhgE
MSRKPSNNLPAERTATAGCVHAVELRIVLWLYLFAIVVGVASIVLHITGFQYAIAVSTLATTIGFTAAAVSHLDCSTLAFTLEIR